LVGLVDAVEVDVTDEAADVLGDELDEQLASSAMAPAQAIATAKTRLDMIDRFTANMVSERTFAETSRP
jgi:hypothetical protein